MAFYNAPPYQGPRTAHFDGTRFRNRDAGPAKGSPGDIAKMVRERKRGEWKFIHEPPGPAPARQVTGGALSVTLVNHATLLVQLDGLNILTDPIWAKRTSPLSFVGPARFRAPAIRFDDLPPIDLILLSHNHYDHLCLPTLKRLAEAHNNPIIYTGLGNAALLSRHGLRSVELDWWDETRHEDKLDVIAAPANHFSGRGPSDRDRTLWLSLLVRGASGSVYFAGDTGYGRHFREVRERYGAPRLALLPIGAFKPRWFMSPIHMDPAEAVTAHLDLQAKMSVAMHYGTFALANDGPNEPLDDLAVALEENGVSPDIFRVLQHGAAQPA